MWRRAARVPATAAFRRLSTAPTSSLTRSLKFREHIFALHVGAPARWTDVALAEHFQVPLVNIQGALALQELEAERAAKGPLDPELCRLGGDVEEYLDDESGTPSRAPRPWEATAAAVPQASATRIETLSSEQERLLAGKVASRFATASLQQLLDSLSADELAQLQGQLGSASLDDEAEESSAAQPAAEEEGGDTEEARDKALRGLLASLALDVPPDDLEAPPTLAPTSLPAPARLAAPRVGGGGAVSGSLPEPDLLGRVPVEQAHLFTYDRKRYDTSKDAEVLRANLKERTERLAPAARKWGRNRGGMIFTEIVKHKRQTKMGTTIERVWASDKGQRGEVRDAEEDEEQRARARVLPRQLPPRIKRTM